MFSHALNTFLLSNTSSSWVAAILDNPLFLIVEESESAEGLF